MPCLAGIPHYFIAITTGLILLIALMLGLLLFFRTPMTSPADRTVALGTFAAPAGLFRSKTEEDSMSIEEGETGTLIGSDKVAGTAVYGRDNEKIGTIERVMIEKTNGRVSYAVLGFGGFLGVGNDHYPLPWNALKYDTDIGGYRVGITEEQLNRAPRDANESGWDWTDTGRTKSVDDYYGSRITHSAFE